MVLVQVIDCLLQGLHWLDYCSPGGSISLCSCVQDICLDRFLRMSLCQSSSASSPAQDFMRHKHDVLDCTLVSGYGMVVCRYHTIPIAYGPTRQHYRDEKHAIYQ